MVGDDHPAQYFDTTDIFYLVFGFNRNGFSEWPGSYRYDGTAPSVKITDPKFNSAHPPGVIVVKGTAFDNAGGSGLKEVEVKVDSSGTYALATPKASGDWSTWSIA